MKMNLHLDETSNVSKVDIININITDKLLNDNHKFVMRLNWFMDDSLSFTH